MTEQELIKFIKEFIKMKDEKFIKNFKRDFKQALEDNLICGSIINEEFKESVVKICIDFIDRYYEYEVVCDETNNTEEDIKNGKMNVDIYIKSHR